MTKSDEERDFEEHLTNFYSDYCDNGRDKKYLISFLKECPYAAKILINDIIEHLENPKKRYLQKRIDIEIVQRHNEIIEMFDCGHHFPFFNADEARKIYDEWTQKSYDEKIYQLTKEFPEYSRSYIEKIISLNKKQ